MRFGERKRRREESRRRAINAHPCRGNRVTPVGGHKARAHCRHIITVKVSDRQLGGVWRCEECGLTGARAMFRHAPTRTEF